RTSAARIGTSASFGESVKACFRPKKAWRCAERNTRQSSHMTRRFEGSSCSAIRQTRTNLAGGELETRKSSPGRTLKSLCRRRHEERNLTWLVRESADTSLIHPSTSYRSRIWLNTADDTLPR